MLFKLHQWLLERYQAGEHTVLVVDEAQNLSMKTLEEIRMLTNRSIQPRNYFRLCWPANPNSNRS